MNQPTMTEISQGTVLAPDDTSFLIVVDTLDRNQFRVARYDRYLTQVSLSDTTIAVLDTAFLPVTPQQARHALFAYCAAVRAAHPARRAAERRAIDADIRPILADLLNRERLDLTKVIAASDGCTSHRETCRFGRDHRWCIGHYDRNGTWHTTMICADCSGVCDAELMLDNEVCACGTSAPHKCGPSPFGVV